MNTSIATTSPNPFPRTAYIAMILFFAALLLGIALPAAVLIWQAATPQSVVRGGDAGQFLSASGANAFFQPALTNVQTTYGSLIVQGLFSAPRGRALDVVELNDADGVHLCAVGDLDTCLPLAGTWAGALTPTPNHTFDFERYGLANSDLWGWVGCGFLLCLISGLVGLVVVVEHADDRDDDGTDTGDGERAA